MFNFSYLNFLESDSPIVITNDDPDPVCTWWIKELGLHMSDKESLDANMDLTDNVINAAHLLLREQYPHIGGLQDTILGQKLLFKPVSSNKTSVQILHTGMYISICMSPKSIT